MVAENTAFSSSRCEHWIYIQCYGVMIRNRRRAVSREQRLRGPRAWQRRRRRCCALLVAVALFVYRIRLDSYQIHPTGKQSGRVASLKARAQANRWRKVARTPEFVSCPCLLLFLVHEHGLFVGPARHPLRVCQRASVSADSPVPDAHDSAVDLHCRAQTPLS